MGTDDFKKIVELEASIEDAKIGLSHDEVDHLVADHTTYTHCLFQGENLLGYVSFRKNRDTDFIRLRRLSVDPWCRYAGHGRRLVNHLLTIRLKIRALVHEENLDAQLFLAKTGFLESRYSRKDCRFIQFQNFKSASIVARIAS